MSIRFSISVSPQLPAMKDPCKTCGVLILRKHMDRHLKVHSGRTISCFICSKTFKTKDSLWQHKKTHDKPENISCNMCSSVFQSKSALRKHVVKKALLMKNTVKTTSPLVLCQNQLSVVVVTKLSKNDSSLTAHMKIHDDTECSFCQKMTSSRPGCNGDARGSRQRVCS